MSIEALANRLPEFAGDIKKNLALLADENILSPTQKAGAFIVAALAVRNQEIVKAVTDQFGSVLSADHWEAIKIISAVMPVYNFYYRFAGLSGNDQYEDMPLKLRLSSLSKIKAAESDSELWIVTISAVNACGNCLKAHEPEARKAGASAEQIQAAIRIAAVIYASACVLESGVQ
jgi:lipoyl-dependent peroxiredoxin subunit D